MSGFPAAAVPSSNSGTTLMNNCRLAGCLSLGLAAILWLAAGFGPAGPARAEATDPDRPLWMRSPSFRPTAHHSLHLSRPDLDRPATGGEARALTERTFRATSRSGRPTAVRWPSPPMSTISPTSLSPISMAARSPADPSCDGRTALCVYAGRHDGAVQSAGRRPARRQSLRRAEPALSRPCEGSSGPRRTVKDGLAASRSACVRQPRRQSLAYAFIRSVEVENRKRQISDGTTDIWLFDRTTGKHRQFTAHRSNERSPVISADGRYVYSPPKCRPPAKAIRIPGRQRPMSGARPSR